jgi:hypothetical protein
MTEDTLSESQSIVQHLSNPTTTVSTKKLVSEELRRAVDWKIFEISSLLIDRNVDNIDFEESTEWFQSRHAEEVIEERVNEKLCGYPLCSNSLSLSPSKGDSSQRFRIDYKEKKIYEIEKSMNYCCFDCLEKSELWIKALDITLPYTRPVVKSLKSSEIEKVTINDVLDLLEPNSLAVKPSNAVNPLPNPPPLPVNNKKSNHSSNSNDDQSILNPPPLYSHPFVDQHGSVNVDFEYGKPVAHPPSPKESGPNYPPARPSAANNLSSKKKVEDKSETEDSEVQNVPVGGTKPFMPKKIAERIKNSGTKSKATEGGVDNQEAAGENENDEDDETTDFVTKYDIPTSSVKQTEISVTIDELMRTMKELQAKHGLKSSPAKSTEEKKKVDNNTNDKQSALWNKELTSVSGDNIVSEPGISLSPLDKEEKNEETLSVNHEEKKAKKQKKSVDWNLPDDQVQQPESGILKTASSEDILSNNLLGRSSAGKGILKSSSKDESSTFPTHLSSKISPVQVSQTSSNVKKPLLGFVVKERTQVQPMSVNALLTKKEPTSLKDLADSQPQYYSHQIEGHYYNQQEN